MNPGPSSARHFSKCAQSTMSGAPSVELIASLKSKRSTLCGRLHAGLGSHEPGISPKRVKTCLAASDLALGRVERVARSAEGQAQRHRPQFKVAAKRVDEVAAIAFG